MEVAGVINRLVLQDDAGRQYMLVSAKDPDLVRLFRAQEQAMAVGRKIGIKWFERKNIAAGIPV